MKPLKRSVKILFILAGAVLLALLVIVANISRSRSQVQGVEVSIRYGHTPELVGRQVVVDSILAGYPNLLQRLVKSVDCDRVAAVAAHVPYLDNVSASLSVSGKVVVRAEQRRPIARLFYGPREYYFDAAGAVFPVSPRGDCNVLVAGGDFTEPLRVDSLNSQMQSLVTLAAWLDSHDEFLVLIDQIYVLRNGDLMMVPKIGDHVIELGSPDDLDSKFDNLLAFYRKGMPRAGWDTYSKISLKFKDQVVCTKK